MSSRPCTECRSTLGRLVKAHMMDVCPLRKALYCGVCAVYGHSPNSCPDTVTMAFREPHLLEQLIPPSVRLEFGITSHTPLDISGHLPQDNPDIIMEVPETEDAIRAALVAAGEKPMICQEKGKREKKEMIENKKKLQKIADACGKKLVYVKDSSTSTATPVKSKGVSKKKAAETL